MQGADIDIQSCSFQDCQPVTMSYTVDVEKTLHDLSFRRTSVSVEHHTSQGKRQVMQCCKRKQYDFPKPC